MTKVKILDCTLRDGGYYNNWDFGQDIISRFFAGMEKSSIDVVELGFVPFQQKLLGAPFSTQQMNLLIN